MLSMKLGDKCRRVQVDIGFKLSRPAGAIDDFNLLF
jgi:hypothetical protein